MFKKYKNKLKNGYTIIETMIALSIFLIVIVVGVGALLNAHLVNKKTQDMRSIMDSLSFSMDDMSRNIRTGSNYHCLDGGGLDINTPVNCIGGFGIAFEPSQGDPIDNADQLIYSINNTGKLVRSNDGGSNYVQMTPNEVVLNDATANFSVIGAGNGDGQQPLVIIRLVGKITSKGNETPFSLQTTVSQRLIDK